MSWAKSAVEEHLAEYVLDLLADDIQNHPRRHRIAGDFISILSESPLTLIHDDVEYKVKITVSLA